MSEWIGSDIDIAEANRRHDQEHGPVRDFADSRIRSAWNGSMLTRGKRLTDSVITKRAKQGWYSEELKTLRRERWQKRIAKAAKREGNFELREGRMIYKP